MYEIAIFVAGFLTCCLICWIVFVFSSSRYVKAFSHHNDYEGLPVDIPKPVDGLIVQVALGYVMFIDHAARSVDNYRGVNPRTGEVENYNVRELNAHIRASKKRL